jgi:hypothetical protein
MPRYFFNFEGENSAAPDLVGQVLSNDEAAKAQAEKLAADIATTSVIAGDLPSFDWVEIIDEHERAVARLPVTRAARGPTRIS